MRLFVEFSSYVPVAAETKIWFPILEVILPGYSRMDGMAVVARNQKGFVLAEIPVFHAPHILVAAETL
jgi:hypothetical protein